MLHEIFLSGKSDVNVLVAAARRGFKMVLRPTAAATCGFTMVSFTEAVRRRNTFVGGTCAPPSALLVSIIIGYVSYYSCTSSESVQKFISCIFVKQMFDTCRCLFATRHQNYPFYAALFVAVLTRFSVIHVSGSRVIKLMCSLHQQFLQLFHVGFVRNSQMSTT